MHEPTSELFPEWVQVISWCLPTTYIFEGMRVILFTGEFPEHYFWINMGLNVIFLVAAISLFRFMFEKNH